MDGKRGKNIYIYARRNIFFTSTAAVVASARGNRNNAKERTPSSHRGLGLPSFTHTTLDPHSRTCSPAKVHISYNFTFVPQIIIIIVSQSPCLWISSPCRHHPTWIVRINVRTNHRFISRRVVLRVITDEMLRRNLTPKTIGNCMRNYVAQNYRSRIADVHTIRARWFNKRFYKLTSKENTLIVIERHLRAVK